MMLVHVVINDLIDIDYKFIPELTPPFNGYISGKNQNDLYKI